MVNNKLVNLCFEKCPNKEKQISKNEYEYECVDECENYIQDNKCVDKCETSDEKTYFIEGKQCVSACSEGLLPFNGICVKSCITKQNGTGKYCVNECNSPKYLKITNGNVSECVDSCDEYVISTKEKEEQRVCTTCQELYFIDENRQKRCMSSCNETGENMVMYRTECALSCDNVNSNTSKLHSFELENKTTVCLESCNGMFVFDNGTCSKDCDKKFYTTENGQFVCTDTCNGVATGYHFNKSNNSTP